MRLFRCRRGTEQERNARNGVSYNMILALLILALLLRRSLSKVARSERPMNANVLQKELS